jgi:hypothetical protein
VGLALWVAVGAGLGLWVAVGSGRSMAGQTTRPMVSCPASPRMPR